jgi:tetratricopeptide (TPR) repeat protein
VNRPWAERRRGAGGALAAIVPISIVLVAIVPAAGCGRTRQVPEGTYREAVTAFYVSLAAMQTSQDAIARRELERLIQLVPDEPAGWANYGLLALRAQQLVEAGDRLGKAAALAPTNAAIERLLAVVESRKGNLEGSLRHWRRAIELDPADLRAPFALAQELERAGGDANESEAFRLLEALASRSGNLAAQLEYARLAARRNDAPRLVQALEALLRNSASWPADARERLTVARDAAQRGASDAVTPVIFLKNVLLREPEYQAAFAAVGTVEGEGGQPIVRLITLPNPEPRPAPADDRLAFAGDAQPAVAVARPSWSGVVWENADGPARVAAAGTEGLRLDGRAALRLPAPMAAAPFGPDGIAAVDLDSDFRTDLALANAGGLEMFRQGADGVYSVATGGTRLPREMTTAALSGVWPADVDTDGDLDLVVALRDGPATILRNNGDGTFAAQSPFGGVTRLRGFVWADLDGEGVPDAALLDDQGAVRLMINLRDSDFREQPVPSGFPRVAAIAAAEITGDGLFDLVGVTPGGEVVRLSQNASASGFETARLARVEPPQQLAPGAARLLAADLDNNGAADLVIAGPTDTRILLGGTGGSLRPLSAAVAVGGVNSAADLDGDGRLELIGRSDAGARAVRTQGQKQYRWQVIRPRATTSFGDQRINSYAIGGEVEVRTGLHAQKQLIAGPVVHFGLGEAASAEVARITWPNGILQSEFNLATNVTIPATQRLKGSCPWLFAWNGSTMGFVTDFIWRSPLGLRINAQAAADVQMTEDWVRIRGDQLAARNGEYDLRITAELWESHFFDLTSLLAVDHPEGTDVFVDERFAVPPPRLGVVATGPLRAFAAVRDDRGTDVAAIVSARDDRHLDFAGRGRYQGVTRQHYVELELPADAPRSGPVWLVAQGWVHPTDSSINVALAQGAHPPPAGLSLHVMDGDGRFRVVNRDLGFPAGKDKTILIDLEGVFPGTGPRRLRLGTNLEIFWDRLGWAIGRPDVKLQPRRLDLTVADLRFRGYSPTEQKDASTPERPRYAVEGVAPRWRDLEGFHTRFGDVRELVEQVDDRYVIMNAGDELRLAFREAPPPPPGFVRDFVLVGDGWVKDGDYNTVASRTLLPLPTHRSPTYQPGSSRLEDDPVYRRHAADFERYHTRYVAPGAARDALRVKIAPNQH